jgi:hypothetical protein
MRWGADRIVTCTPSSSVRVTGHTGAAAELLDPRSATGASIAPEHPESARTVATRGTSVHLPPSFRRADQRTIPHSFRSRPPLGPNEKSPRLSPEASINPQVAASLMREERGRTASRQVSWLPVGLLANRSVSIGSGGAALPRTFPGYPSGISRVRSPVTVARPRRSLTGFPLGVRTSCRPARTTSRRDIRLGRILSASRVRVRRGGAGGRSAGWQTGVDCAYTSAPECAPRLRP